MRATARNRGIVSVLAMMIIVIFSALAAAMAIVSQSNLQTAQTYQRVNRALAASETGLQWANYRVAQVAATILTTQGEIDEDMADQLWPVLVDQIIAQMDNEPHSLEASVLENSEKLVLGRIAVDDEPAAPTFQITIQRHPLAGEDYDGPIYQQAPYNVGSGNNQFTADGNAVTSANPITRVWVRIRSVGEDGPYARSTQMDFRIDKKIRFALLSRNRVMIGRNVMIRGTIGSKYVLTNEQYGHPVQIRDNFHNLDPTLDAQLNAFKDFLAANDVDGDNRVWLEDNRESGALADPNFIDHNGDGYVDSYDLFLGFYDANLDAALSIGEFVDGSGQLHDAQLWQLINEVKYPPGTKFNWQTMEVQIPGMPWIDATADLTVINNGDKYAKILGEVLLKATKSAWESGAAAGPYQEYLRDSIIPDDDDPPLTFDSSDGVLVSFDPVDFDMTTYQNLATGVFADQVAAATPNDSSAPVVYTPPGAATMESMPFNSPHPYDYYERPIYENYVFTNVTIPVGTNALFRNCKFVGVTFVATETHNTDANFNFAGMQNPDGSLKYPSATVNINGTIVSDTKPYGNNIRFDNCTFEGMVASDSPQEYSHVRNKLQFSGRTVFDLEAPGISASEKELYRKSTILTPQYSVDMGTFVDPTSTQEVVQLDGTIVAGVFDVRGQATIDGSVITTYEPVPGQGPLAQVGNPAQFNTTIGYFESSAGDGEAEIPVGGFGKIIIRYDPTRALPDGINGPIEVRPVPSTYVEGGR